jgi:hypothetical protein
LRWRSNRSNGRCRVSKPPKIELTSEFFDARDRPWELEIDPRLFTRGPPDPWELRNETSAPQSALTQARSRYRHRTPPQFWRHLKLIAAIEEPLVIANSCSAGSERAVARAAGTYRANAGTWHQLNGTRRNLSSRMKGDLHPSDYVVCTIDAIIRRKLEWMCCNS